MSEAARLARGARLERCVALALPALLLLGELLLLRRTAAADQAASVVAGLGLTIALAPLLGLGWQVEQSVRAAHARGDHRAVSSIVDSAFTASLAAGFLLGLLAYNLAEFALPLVLPPGQVLANSYPFLELRGWSLLLAGGVLVLRGFFLGVGRPLVALSLALVMLLLHLPVSWILAGGRFGAPELGLPGMALATVLALALTLSLGTALAALERDTRERYHLFRWSAVELGTLLGTLRGALQPAAAAALPGAGLLFLLGQVSGGQPALLTALGGGLTLLALALALAIGPRHPRTVSAQRARGTRAGSEGSSPADLSRAGTAGPAVRTPRPPLFTGLALMTLVLVDPTPLTTLLSPGLALPGWPLRAAAALGALALGLSLWRDPRPEDV